MKGLILKELYMVRKYCKAYFLIAAVFIAVSFVGNENMFFTFYPCLLCGMTPVTLLGYDERSRWLQYSETMPYTKAELVSAKYLIGLAMQTLMLLSIGIAQIIRMRLVYSFNLEEYLALMMLLLTMSLVTSSISLPFMFKLGVEKGRMAYYFMIGAVCAGSVISSSILSDKLKADAKIDTALPLACIIAVVIYALSWYLSIVFYKKREV